jgi:hypothetical protein
MLDELEHRRDDERAGDPRGQEEHTRQQGSKNGRAAHQELSFGGLFPIWPLSKF